MFLSFIRARENNFLLRLNILSTEITKIFLWQEMMKAKNIYIEQPNILSLVDHFLFPTKMLPKTYPWVHLEKTFEGIYFGRNLFWKELSFRLLDQYNFFYYKQNNLYGWSWPGPLGPNSGPGSYWPRPGNRIYWSVWYLGRDWIK